MRTITGELEQDIQLDKMQLDTECEIQSALYYHYSRQLADAREALDRAKDRVKVVEAQKDLYYRRNPPTDLKATEKVFVSLVEDDRELADAREDLIKKSHTVDILWAMMGALDNRKEQLANLTKLQISSYYNANTNTNDVSSARDRLNSKS